MILRVDNAVRKMKGKITVLSAITSDGQFLYAFYELASPEQGARLFAVKYALTDDFPRLAYTAQPIATGPYWHDAQPGDETLDDPAPVLGPDSLFCAGRGRP